MRDRLLRISYECLYFSRPRTREEAITALVEAVFGSDESDAFKETLADEAIRAVPVSAAVSMEALVDELTEQVYEDLDDDKEEFTDVRKVIAKRKTKMKLAAWKEARAKATPKKAKTEATRRKRPGQALAAALRKRARAAATTAAVSRPVPAEGSGAASSSTAPVPAATAVADPSRRSAPQGVERHPDRAAWSSKFSFTRRRPGATTGSGWQARCYLHGKGFSQAGDAVLVCTREYSLRQGETDEDALRRLKAWCLSCTDASRPREEHMTMYKPWPPLDTLPPTAALDRECFAQFGP